MVSPKISLWHGTRAARGLGSARALDDLGEHFGAGLTAREIDFFIDWDAPTVKLRADRQLDRVIVEAHDVLTPDDALQFAYAVGDEVPGPFGAAREISLSAVEVKGGVRVLVRDERGNVGEARYRVGVERVGAARELSPVNELGATSQSNGCSAAPWSMSVVGALVLFLRRRR